MSGAILRLVRVNVCGATTSHLTSLIMPLLVLTLLLCNLGLHVVSSTPSLHFNSGQMANAYNSHFIAYFLAT